MAKVGFIGLTYVDSKGVRKGTKFNWHKDAKRIVGPAVAIALQKAGLEVRRATQRSMVGGSTPAGRSLRSNPVWWRVGEYKGIPVVAYVRKVPRPDKVSSWAPQAMLRNDVQSRYDPQTESVVVGPSKFPWLNKLHEFGGSVGVYVQRTKYPVKEFGGSKVPQKFQGRAATTAKGRKRPPLVGAYVGIFDNYGGNFYLGTRTVRGRGYMAIGLQASMRKIPAQFRDTISGKFAS